MLLFDILIPSETKIILPSHFCGCWIYNHWDLCYNLFCCNIYCDTCISCALCETDINSSYAVPIRPRFIRNTEIDANGHGKL